MLPGCTSFRYRWRISHMVYVINDEGNLPLTIFLQLAKSEILAWNDKLVWNILRLGIDLDLWKNDQLAWYFKQDSCAEPRWLHNRLAKGSWSTSAVRPWWSMLCCLLTQDDLRMHLARMMDSCPRCAACLLHWRKGLKSVYRHQGAMGHGPYFRQEKTLNV